jgi:hypothetical protein
MGYLMDPPLDWANVDDCNEFPCTAPMNVFLKFENTQFSGTNTPTNDDAEFQIMGNNENVAKPAGC